jgi:spore coat polysaccharide biosynthesis protein SpsF
MILGVLQARMTSSRLPGKVMAPVLGTPMIGRQIERLARSARLDRIVVATSEGREDDPLAAYCVETGVAVVRGPLDDVLGRFCKVMDQAPEASTIVRMTADCPLADWTVVDLVIDRHLASGADYTSNVMPDRTFPHGLDIEVVRRNVLARAGVESDDAFEREHVTPFIYRRPAEFRIENVTRQPSLAHLRWTVDLPEDLDFVRHVYGELYPRNPAFLTEDIAALSRNSSTAA